MLLARRFALVGTALLAVFLLSTWSGPPLAQAAFEDSDLDGFIDILEISAGSDPFDPASTPEDVSLAAATAQPLCSDGVDNDLDGLTDASDPDCVDSDGDFVSNAMEIALGSDQFNGASTPEDANRDVVLAFLGSPYATCSDGIDNDLDGLTDGADPGCPTLDSDTDGFDNVEEKLYGSDPLDLNSTPEHDGPNPGSCSDGLDNDTDSAIDAADSGCQASLFIFPMDCELNVECFYVNYIDHDPSPGLQDYMCGVETLDGHGGTDITLRDFRLMDEGVDVYAAADGVVLATTDGYFDRNTTFGFFPSNTVVILHPNGLRTAYLHLRNGSVAVVPGQAVVQGEVIGLTGSSGNSTQAHVHFHVLDSNSNTVDPWAGPCGNTVSLWAAQDPYEDFFLLIDDYLLAESPSFDQLKEGPLSDSSLPPTADFMCYAVQVLSVPAGGTHEFRFFGPGSVPTVSFSKGVYFRHSYWWGCALGDTLRLNPGAWVAQYWHNGVFVSSRTFSVVTAVGGIAELPEVAGTPLETPDTSGPSTAVLAAVAGAVAAALALGGAAWYARRRWTR